MRWIGVFLLVLGMAEFVMLIMVAAPRFTMLIPAMAVIAGSAMIQNYAYGRSNT